MDQEGLGMYLLMLALIFHADLELRTIEGVENLYCQLRSQHGYLTKYDLVNNELKLTVDCTVLFHDGFE